MTIKQGDKLPDATLLTLGAAGPEPVQLADRLAGRRVALFGLPGAFTRTCSGAHVPSFIRTHDAIRAKGVDEVICIAVNDPFVMSIWGDQTGGTAAGITFLADASAAFTKAIGMDMTAPAAGFYDRSRRYALVAEDGVVTILNEEVERGACEISSGETLLTAL